MTNSREFMTLHEEISVGICSKLYCEALREKRLAERKQDGDSIEDIQELKS